MEPNLNQLYLCSDTDLIQEIKRRGLRIEVEDTEYDGEWYNARKISIGGVLFDINR